MTRIIKVHPADNVAIAVKDLEGGTEIAAGLTTREDIPQGYKIALRDLKKGEELIRYGVSLGRLTVDVKAGGLIGEDFPELPPAPDLNSLPWGIAPAVRNFSNIPADGADPDLPDLPKTFEGYEVPRNPFAGTRNILGIMTTVQCVTGVVNVAVRRIREELLPKYPQVDDVTAINHAYGCGVAIDGRDSDIPRRTLKNLLHNPNFGGEILVVALGCEKYTPEMLLEPEENNPENVLVLQNSRGFREMTEAILAMAEGKLRRLNQRRRKTLPLEKLCVGFQCGGSDAFSGVTANPAAGYAGDLLVRLGGTCLFSEVTEVRDGVQYISARCTEREVAEKLVREMRWYDEYLARGGATSGDNPSPGNRQGGLSNIVEKTMGAIAKSGCSPITEVLSPGERPSRRGLIFAATPSSDFICGPLQLASGIVLQVFMTGRGTPYGLAAAPVIKVSSRTDLQDLWPDLIDLNAGTIAEGRESIEAAGERLFRMIIAAADGRYKPRAEEYRLHNDICLFDPSPMT
ncbi:MAG: UxaA family hydrolase [Treponema sp.]|jgi:galactarate dehydratase|nr:UxaA family hydrolase [Treponema sp.]